MLTATFALILVTVENFVARQIQDSARTEATLLATFAAHEIGSGISGERVLSDRVVAFWDEEGCLASEEAPDGICDGIELEERMFQRIGADWYAFPKVQSLTVAVTMPDLEERQRRARGFLWPFFLIDAIFVLALGYAFFTFVVVRPLRAIGVASVRASEGDFASPIALLPKNEFGEVGRSFNKMLERIESGRKALESQIEEVQRTNARLASTRASLVRSEKLASVGQLAAGIAHEVGNPLAAVSGYVELLEDDSLTDEERADIHERVKIQLERIRGIIRNLLDYSRSEDGHELTPTNLVAVTKDAVSLIKAIPRARHASIEVEGEGVAHSVPGHITQVVVNLLMNAVDAAEDAPEIVVRIYEDDDQALVEVRDSGPGMSPDVLSRIFDPFFTTKEPGSGTGLGLSICQRIVEDVGGELEVTSAVGEGTTFVIRLPREGQSK